MSTYSFYESCGLLHWAAAFAGIICLLLVRIIGVNEFSMRKWLNENLIGLIWSIFVLSLFVTLTHEYFPDYRIVEAFLTGFCGTYLISRLTREPRTRKPYNLKKPHNS